MKHNIPEIEKVISINKNRICFFGEEYHETYKLNTDGLQLFIERDIYMAKRNAVIPKGTYRVQIINDRSLKVLCQVERIKDQCSQKDYLEYEISKIISNYNRTTFQVCANDLVPIETKFNFKIDITEY